MTQAREGGHPVRWVDVRKADGSYRSRFVAKEVKTYEAPELFADMPPIVSLKYLLCRAAQDPTLNVMHVDVTRAYFYADASREISVKLPAEDQQDGDEQMCGRLKKAMYGTRDVAQNWQRKCAETMKEIGFAIGDVSPCHFFHSGWQVCGLMHMDDFVFAGYREYFDKIADHMRGKFKVKVAMAGLGDREPLRMLNRSSKWTEEGLVYESDHQHVERLIEELQLCKGQVVITPAICESRKALKKDTEQHDQQNDGEENEENAANERTPPRPCIAQSRACRGGS